MSASSNMELVRSIYAAWQRNDYSSTNWADPEIEFVLGDGPDAGSWRGVAGMTEGWRAFLRSWEDYRLEVEEYRELDVERILIIIRHRGRGKSSGLRLQDMAARGANLVHLRGGKITRIVLYFDIARAYADLGLSDLDSPPP